LVDPSTYRYYGYTVDENGRPTTYCIDRAAACYQTDAMGAKANDILRGRAGKRQPFFMWLALVADHAGAPKDAEDPASIPTPVVPPRFRNALQNAKMPLPPSF